jgi:hypothetical protein
MAVTLGPFVRGDLRCAGLWGAGGVFGLGLPFSLGHGQSDERSTEFLHIRWLTANTPHRESVPVVLLSIVLTFSML